MRSNFRKRERGSGFSHTAKEASGVTGEAASVKFGGFRGSGCGDSTETTHEERRRGGEEEIETREESEKGGEEGEEASQTGKSKHGRWRWKKYENWGHDDVVRHEDRGGATGRIPPAPPNDAIGKNAT